jgi:hypothetical protein
MDEVRGRILGKTSLPAIWEFFRGTDHWEKKPDKGIGKSVTF